MPSISGGSTSRAPPRDPEPAWTRLSTTHMRRLAAFRKEMQPVSALQRCFQASARFARRSFSTHPIRAIKHLPPRPKLDDADITGTYLKGSGPGGQKINKTNSAVQLIHKPTGIVVKSQATRSRSQNQKIAREILAEKVEALEKGEQSRAAIKAAVKRKRKASAMKKKRRKYRALEEEKRKNETTDDFDQSHDSGDPKDESSDAGVNSDMVKSEQVSKGA